MEREGIGMGSIIFNFAPLQRRRSRKWHRLGGMAVVETRTPPPVTRHPQPTLDLSLSLFLIVNPGDNLYYCVVA